MKEEKEKSTWKAIRGMFNTIHLWLGVGSSVILFIVCLTGTIYTFAPEIQKFTDAELYSVTPVNERLASELVITKMLDSLGGGTVQSLTIPEAANGTYQISVVKHEKKSAAFEKTLEPQRPKSTTYFVNPYTAEILGTNETSSSAFFMTMFRAHRWLLLDTSIGRPIVGVATMIFLVLILSGLVIWFPKKFKNWRQGLKIKTDANWKRINHDLHNALGLYAAIFLFVMAITGLTWSFQWYKTGFNNVFGVVKKDDQKKPESAFTEGARSATVEVILKSADEVLPYPGDYRINFPQDSIGVISISKTRNSFFATSVSDRISLDQYSGQVLSQEIFSQKPFNEKIVSSIKALHIGSFYGTFSKIIYFVACLIGTSLPVTGIFIWINKLRKSARKAEKRSMRGPSTASV
jgi:uncharacterized iron-regulated membrane protein